jgi:hypothetical protein
MKEKKQWSFYAKKKTKGKKKEKKERNTEISSEKIFSKNPRRKNNFIESSLIIREQRGRKLVLSCFLFVVQIPFVLMTHQKWKSAA